MRGARVLRAVGDPATRFEEDALRMIRAVRLATTLEFEVDAETLAGIRDASRAGRPPVGRADRRRARQAPGRAAAVDRAPAAVRDRAARADLRRPRGAAGHRPEQGPGRGPVGPHAAVGRRVAGDSAGGQAGRPPPRHRQAGHVRRRPLPRSRRGRCRAGRGVPRAVACPAIGARSGRRARPPPHVQLRGRTGRTRRSGGSSASCVHSATGSSRTCSRLREADNVGSGLPANAGRLDELRARIATELAAEAVLDRSGLVIDGR